MVGIFLFLRLQIREWQNVRTVRGGRTFFFTFQYAAITSKESQGLTLNQVVIDLNQHEFATGQAYVAISWVKRPGCLLFEAPLRITAQGCGI
jgi:hypothetical protein